VNHEMKCLRIIESMMDERAQKVEEIVRQKRPDLLEKFFIYSNEAINARLMLEKNLADLDLNSTILEVGGGTMALSIQLLSEGYKITSVEPLGKGFSEISFLMNVYLEVARAENICLTIIPKPIESLTFNQAFDFVFSINVMEHLTDPYGVLIQINEMLRQNGEFRFVCPNYDFPYEPHFGKFLFIRKKRAFFLPKRIAKSSRLTGIEADDLYSSINFITFKKLSRILNKNKAQFRANRHALYDIYIRSLKDSQLQVRHQELYKIVRLTEALKISFALRFVPPQIQPVIDITVFKF